MGAVVPPSTSTIERWEKSSYVAETPVGKLAEWKLILEQPVAPFQKILYDRYAVRFSMLLVVVSCLLGPAEFLSRRIVSTAEQLGVITLDLPAKLASQGPVAWPEMQCLKPITSFSILKRWPIRCWQSLLRTEKLTNLWSSWSREDA